MCCAKTRIQGVLSSITYTINQHRHQSSHLRFNSSINSIVTSRRSTVSWELEWTRSYTPGEGTSIHQANNIGRWELAGKNRRYHTCGAMPRWPQLSPVLVVGHLGQELEQEQEQEHSRCQRWTWPLLQPQVERLGVDSYMTGSPSSRHILWFSPGRMSPPYGSCCRQQLSAQSSYFHCQNITSLQILHMDELHSKY